MSFQNTLNLEIGTGTEICTACKSDKWKSAKMVVMEGTTLTIGTTTSESHSAFRDFLLSDSWFSWEKMIDTGVVFSTRTGLVEEVKKFMIAQGSMVQIPNVPLLPCCSSEPQRPQEIQEPQMPTLKPLPKKPIPPDEPSETSSINYIEKPDTPSGPQTIEKPICKPWYVHFSSCFWEGIPSLLIIVLLYSYFKPEDVKFFADFLLFMVNEVTEVNILEINKLEQILITILFCFSFGTIHSLVYSFFKNYDMKRIYFKKVLKQKNMYQNVLRIHEQKIDKYNKKVNYDKNLSKYTKDKESNQSWYEREMEKYNINMNEYKHVCHEINIEYERQNNNVLKIRELLWERAHVCMRCGTTYLGTA